VAALRLIGVLVIALSIPATGSTQTAQSAPWFVRTGATSGYILPANPFLASADHPGGAIRWGQNLTFEIGRQTDGNQDWHQLYGVPSYGFGFSVASFSNDVAHARPVEAYTFFSWPFARLGDRLDLTTDFGMGMSWHWKEMNDSRAESYETSLGSDLNARINWGFYVRYASTPQVTIFTGVDYTHRSNGGMVQPDRGINVIGPKVALQYSLTPTEARVFELLIAGHSTAEVAKAMAISPNTLKWHTRQLFEKTNQHRRTDLVRLAGKLRLAG